MFPLLDLASTIINKLFPDKTQADAYKAQLLQLQEQGALKEIEEQYNLAGQQVDVDKQEAAVGQSLTGWKALFVSGWRPSVGWTCSLALFVSFMVMPFVQLAIVLERPDFDISKLPHLDWGTLSPILLGMLGLGVMRTVEKVNGVDAGV